jgi:hypothetical protein
MEKAYDLWIRRTDTEAGAATSAASIGSPKRTRGQEKLPGPSVPQETYNPLAGTVRHGARHGLLAGRQELPPCTRASKAAMPASVRRRSSSSDLGGIGTLYATATARQPARTGSAGGTCSWQLVQAYIYVQASLDPRISRSRASASLAPAKRLLLGSKLLKKKRFWGIRHWHPLGAASCLLTA